MERTRSSTTRMTFCILVLIASLQAANAASEESVPPLASRAMAAWDAAAVAAVMRDAKNAEGIERDLALGIAYHNLAVSKPEGNADEAIERLSAASASSASAGIETRAIALAYRGSALTLKASLLNEAKNVIGASALLGEGSDLMDEAARMAPGSLAIRFLRADNALSVTSSSPFDRSGVAEEDLDAIETRLEELSPGDRARWHILSGRLAVLRKDIRTAVARFEAAVKASPSSAEGKEARRLLARYAD
jgi:hypothetical protein